MKKILVLLMLGFLISCGNSARKDYTIIKEDKNIVLKTATIDIRLNKKINRTELKNIALKLKKERPDFKRLWIFYYLPGNKIERGAWATTNFYPKLEVKILGATKASYKELENRKVTGDIIHIWNDNDAVMPNKIYLVKENGELYMKTLYAKSGLTKATELVEKVIETKKNGVIRFDYDNKNGEYFVLEKNGNLGLYDEDGKFKEVVKEK